MTRDGMHISEAELSAMTRDLDDLHRSSFPQVLNNLASISPSRRGLLLGAGGVAAAGLLSACRSDSPDTPAASGSGMAGKYTGDMKVVALAAALENLAVTAYSTALIAAGKGALGTVPPAVGKFVQVAMAQHTDHAAAWNGVLSKAGLPQITDVPLSITSSEVAKLGAAKTVGDVAKIALDLENAAAQTYTFATANVTDAGGIMTAATIQPVEAMHAAILNLILGQYPVPDTFVGVNGAVKPDALQR